MQTSKITYLIPFLLFGGILLAFSFSENKTEYIKIDHKKAKLYINKDNFNQMMDVITHPRCMNCHPNDNLPKQGNDSHPHYFGMKRGKNDQGFDATKCATCHQKENNNFSGVPGAQHWGLAPEKMGWQGLTRKEIATSMLDKNRNGGKNYKELIKHLTEDDLVLWAWNPGINAEGIAREKPPVSKENFKIVVEKWFAAGAIIPED